MKKSDYIVVGLMSGTSLDGLDLILLRFNKDFTWQYQILKSETISYTDVWRRRLQEAYYYQNQKDIDRIDLEYGVYLGKMIKGFIANTQPNIDFVASHGHTIFHRPNEGITKQIGDAREISKICGLDVIHDFRTLDVSLGGQGAPLVPIGDRLLFAEYSACINLGGFANISYEQKGKRVAYDICPVNLVINYLTRQIGKEYDDEGAIASAAQLSKALFKELNALDYYQESPPKSLGREWVEENLFPILNRYDISIKDKIRTFTDHAALMISKAVSDFKGALLFTGGGTYNHFLINTIKSNIKTCTISIPNADIIDFKEALIFAFMGVLRSRKEINVLRSVTGASQDSCSGQIIHYSELTK